MRTMEVFGAELEIIESPNGIHPGLIPAMMSRAVEIVEETGGYATDQFNNHDAIDGYRGIGEEVVAQLDGPVDAFCSFIGVGGCFIGSTTAIRERWPDLLRVIVEPDESAVVSGRPPGTHRIEGGGVGFVPPLVTPNSYDRVETVSTEEAMATARAMARAEGVWTGPSGGANVRTAIRLASELGAGHRVVTIQPDSGLKYLAGALYA
jgi:cysteine synthase A